MPLKKVLGPDMPENTVFFCFFGVALVFLTLGSPSSRYKLPGPKTKINEENTKTMHLNKVLGPDIPENPLFFCFSCVSLVFLGCFWFLAVLVADKSFRNQNHKKKRGKPKTKKNLAQTFLTILFFFLCFSLFLAVSWKFFGFWQS